jgi:hypothetical protein
MLFESFNRNGGKLKEVFALCTCLPACPRLLLTWFSVGDQNYPQNPLDFSPLSTYFINTYPAVLRVPYRLSGAASQNT